MSPRSYLSKASKNIDFPVLIKIIANNLQAQLKMNSNTGDSNGSASAPGSQDDFMTRLAAMPSQSTMQRYLADNLSSAPVSESLYAKHQAQSQGEYSRKARCATGEGLDSACKAPQAARMPRFEAQSPSYGRFSAIVCPGDQRKPANEQGITSKSAEPRSSSIKTEFSGTVSRHEEAVRAKVSSVGNSKLQARSKSTK